MTGSECAACKRNVKLTAHHLIPVSQHGRVSRRTGISKRELKGKVVGMCGDCHSQLHSIFTEKELANSYYEVGLFMADERFAKFVEWVSGRRGTFGHKRAADRR